LNIGHNIGKYWYLGMISAKYKLKKDIGIGKNIGIGLAKISVSAKISTLRKYWYRYRLNPYRSNPIVWHPNHFPKFGAHTEEDSWIIRNLKEIFYLMLACPRLVFFSE
jgi:hypothetical protein